MSQNKRQIFAFLALRFNLKRIGAKKLAVSLIFPAFVAVFIAVLGNSSFSISLSNIVIYLGDNSKFQDSIVQFCALGMIPLARNIVIFLVDEKSSGQYDLMKVSADVYSSLSLSLTTHRSMDFKDGLIKYPSCYMASQCRFWYLMELVLSNMMLRTTYSISLGSYCVETLKQK